ncbi:zinc-binding dehydrogenase [Solirubrobacter soli]|uniref:zinc-binding dehydrogenase n=1 Tax=Solirubrobacter soli TaxID=363832 RepID=UPI00041D05B4|nr:zinc-binding dehydrogenase [Solirubrobacter soli]
MWAYAISAPGRLERVEVDRPSAGEGRVLARLLAGGICGSDLPSFIGRRNTFVDFYGEPGYPLHEVVGEVVGGALPVGTRFVGWAEHHLGLAEYFVARVDAITPIPDFTDVQATVVQPLCTVLHQLDRAGDVRGARVAVVGQGSIGLLFSHALKARGAAWVTGVDRVDRSDVSAAFGVDEAVCEDAAAWSSVSGDAFDLVVEAVGHHAGPLEAAVTALAPHGTVLAFGVPDESHYAFPFRTFFRKHATLIAGAATDRANALARAHAYLLEHRALLDPYVTTVVGVHEAQRAFETALVPSAGRIKVVLDGSM